MSPCKWRNPLASLALLGLILIASFLGPPTHVKEGHLYCLGGGAQEVFPSMDSCAADPRYKSGGCSCHRPRNEAHTWYSAVAVPTLVALASYLLLTGSIGARLFWMCLALIGAVFVQFALAIAENAAAALYALPEIPLSVAIICSVASAWVLVIHYGRRVIIRNKGKADDI